MVTTVILLVILTFVDSLVLGDVFPIVQTPDGSIQGQISKSYGGAPYIEFLGIPYAQPPIGELRFEDPVLVKPWNDTMIANKTRICLQVDHTVEPEGGLTMGTEDCLYLNVYVPGTVIDPTKKLDVVFNIHGGAFMFGNSHFAEPKFMMDRNVILVTINYRLGVFGFLSTGDRHLPGNLGMKDQVMTMRWAKKYIQYFGGNKDSVMIGGLSAGGASVHYHYLSPLSRGLFTRGISHSGCVLNSWTIQEEPLKKARIIGRAVGCTQALSMDLVTCLKGKPGADLNEALRLLRPWLFNPFSPLALVVDKDSDNPFLPEHPYKLLKDKKVYDAPWILTATTSEGLYPAAEFMAKSKHLPNLDEHWFEYAPAIMHYMETITDKKKNFVSRQAKNEYIGDAPIGNDTYFELVQMISDRLFVADEKKAARMHAKAVKSPTYFYSFDYIGEKRPSLAWLLTGVTENLGVSHGDDVMFIFTNGKEGKPAELTAKDEAMKNFLLDVWTSFASTGRPKPDNWQPVSKRSKDPFRYMYIGRDQEIVMKESEEMGHRSFWDSLNFKENENLFKKNS